MATAFVVARSANEFTLADFNVLNRFVEQWRGARGQKMALKVFKLPGGEGGLHKPYLMPSDAEVGKRPVSTLLSRR